LSKSSKKKPSVAKNEVKPADEAQPAPTQSHGRSQFKMKSPEEKKEAHKEGIIKTAVAAIIGMVAGIIAYMQLGEGIPGETGYEWYVILMFIVGISFYVMKFSFPIFKIKPKEFGFKDWFYVEFIVVDFCLVTWTLLLN
jgi:cbb3-type cytochrome oxidase subunit 1